MGGSRSNDARAHAGATPRAGLCGATPRASLRRALTSEVARLRRSPLVALHLLLACALGVAAGWYFGTTPWDSRLACDAFVQLLGAAAPLLVGLACGLSVDAEREAGDCANLLGVPSRARALLAKALVLLALGVAAAALAVGIFAAIMAACGRVLVSPAVLVCAVLGTGAGAAALYLLALGVALMWGRNAAIAAGAASLVVALMSIGGLANGLVTGTLSGGMTSGLAWLPLLWPVRLASLPMELAIAGTDAVAQGAAVAPGLAASLAATLASCAGITVLLAIAACWAINRFEDRRRAAA